MDSNSFEEFESRLAECRSKLSDLCDTVWRFKDLEKEQDEGIFTVKVNMDWDRIEDLLDTLDNFI